MSSISSRVVLTSACVCTVLAFSEDNEYLAYGLSKSGSDWATIKILKVEGPEDLPDILEKVKFSCLSWTHDGKGIFYNRYPDQEGSMDGMFEKRLHCYTMAVNCVS